MTSGARFDGMRDSYPHVRSVKWTHEGSWEHPGDAVTKTLTNITPTRATSKNWRPSYWAMRSRIRRS
ncbi:hypothetical protein [Tessaracoccus coleopterorum]|uniref:hypothetical protein n=1 Tax=Tessaracoccus coleopterorum TaxID=2714950 RepID=UPI0018D35FEF|nr:hypothetical protein [Tessaracoccus coleopterorum]